MAEEEGSILNVSELRVVVIKGLKGTSDVLFRCEPSVEGRNTCSFCERVIYDALKSDVSWTKCFNINRRTFLWYLNNSLQSNTKGWPIRLFHIPLDREVDHIQLLQMLHHLCNVVTSCKGNKERLIVNEEDLYWMDDNVVWSDVIGFSTAISMIRLQKGNIYAHNYEEHEDFILTYFRRDQVGELQELLALPVGNRL